MGVAGGAENAVIFWLFPVGSNSFDQWRFIVHPWPESNEAVSWRNVMSKPKLNKDEKEILKDFEAGEFESVLTPKRKKYIQASAEETFKKDKRINIRISSSDLTSL